MTIVGPYAYLFITFCSEYHTSLLQQDYVPIFKAKSLYTRFVISSKNIQQKANHGYTYFKNRAMWTLQDVYSMFGKATVFHSSNLVSFFVFVLIFT